MITCKECGTAVYLRQEKLKTWDYDFYFFCWKCETLLEKDEVEIIEPMFKCIECEAKILSGRVWCDSCIKELFFVTDEDIENENASKNN